MNFNFDLRKVIIVIFLLGLPLFSINMQRNPNEAPWYLKPFTWSLSTLQYTYANFSEKVQGTTRLYLDLWDIRRQIHDLLSENSELKARQLTFEELNQENQRLRGLLDFSQRSKMQLLAAKVIGRDLIGDRDTIFINRGTAHGLKGNQAVISAQGAVGYIDQPELFTSPVRVLTDRDAVIDSIVQRSRAQGITEGTNDGSCQLRHLERADDVRVGDLVVTSGLDNIFPKGFPVGTVTLVKKSQYGISQEVEVNPVVKPEQLEEIFVVFDAANEVYEQPVASKTEAQ